MPGERLMSSHPDFTAQRQRRTEEIEALLQSALPEEEGDQKLIMQAMAYSLMAGGKRLRPMLMQETHRLFDGNSPSLPRFMAAIEMIHTYSLVHDDLPAMDNDEYRRGKKTTHAVYGEDIGILTGDALLNYAFETADSAFAQTTDPDEMARIGQALQILGEKAGIHGMIGGQVIDVRESGKPLSRETLDHMYELKTGALIEASMMIGAVLAGASEEDVKKVEQIASDIGLAFQIQDDILDVTGTDEKLGKPAHSDEKNEKTTYPVLLGIEPSARIVEEKTDEAVALLRQLPGKNDFLEELLLSLVHREQ